jgi:hypothetical protein
MLDEVIHYDTIIVLDGVHGRTNGATYCHWKYNDSAYNPEITGAMTHIH